MTQKKRKSNANQVLLVVSVDGEINSMNHNMMLVKCRRKRKEVEKDGKKLSCMFVATHKLILASGSDSFVYILIDELRVPH